MNKKLLGFVLGAVVWAWLPRIASADATKNPTGPTGEFSGSITTGGSIDPYTGNAKRFVTDLSVTGAVGVYPLKWTRVLNTRGGRMGPLGGGGQWAHSYQWGLWLDRNPPADWDDPEGGEYSGPAGQIIYPDGRTVDLQSGDFVNYEPLQPFDGVDRVVRAAGDDYTLLLRDGGRVEFKRYPGAPSTGSLRPTEIIDPHGLKTQLTYDSANRLIQITEPAGRYLQINWIDKSYWKLVGGQWRLVVIYLIGSVQAFAAPGNLVETVSYAYVEETISDYWGSLRTYQLTQAFYDGGTQATYDYFPYTLTTGGHAVPAKIKSCNDVRFDGPMKQIVYEYSTAAGAPEGVVTKEKNFTTGQTVSEVIYPANCFNPPNADPSYHRRTERRPDGATRAFQYADVANNGTCELQSYSDFQNHWSSIAYGGAPNGNWTKILTDARLKTTTIEKEPVADQPIRIYNPDSTSKGFAYYYVNGAPYYLAIQGDELDRNTYYTRSAADNWRVTKIWYGFDNNNHNAYPTEEFTYNNFGQVLTHKLTTGGTESFGYDNEAVPATRGLKTRWTDARGNTTRYQYYTSGPNTDRLWKVTDPRNNTTTFEYNLRGQVTKVIHPYPDNSYTQSFYNPDGTLAWSADENHPGAVNDPNQRTRYVYDDYKRVVSVTNPMNETTTNVYAPWNGAGSLSHTTSTVYQTLSPMGKQVHHDYDANLRRTITRTGVTADDAWSFFEYDEVGNLTKTTDPRGKVTVFGYDNRNRQIWMNNPIATDRNSNGHTIEWAYDAAGNKIKETRTDNAFRTWEYETITPMNRLTKTVDWRMSTAEPAVATVYGRNVTSTQETITDSKGAVYTFEFDALHRKTKETYPVDYTGQARTETWSYDPAGNLALYKNAANQYRHSNHDNRNRPWDSWWDGGVGPTTSKRYDAAGRITSVTTNNGETVVEYGYDDANRKIWEDQTLAGHPKHRVETNRDADGNRANLRVPGNYDIRFEYNQRNQLWKIKGGDANIPMASYTFDSAGNVTNRRSDYLYAHGASMTYDDLNRVTGIDQGDANVYFQHNHYQYDKVGREVATWRDELGSKGERFTYNVRNQLTNSHYEADQVWTGNPQNPQRTVSYDVDPLNRQSVWDSAEPKPNGLSATYYSNGDFTGTAVMRNDATVNFAWNGAQPMAFVPGEWFSVRWEGQVVPRYSQTYTFYTQTDDGVRLWVDGQLLIDNWTYHALTENSGTITLVAGQRYSIRMEYFQGTGGAVAALLWSSPSQGKEVIPSSQLYAARPANGLQATYYDNIDFTGTKVLRTDPAINFNWGGGSPEPTMGVDYFSVRWEGQIVPRYTETYTFYAGSDDGVRLWINGQLIVDNWWDRAHTEGTGTINLVMGQSYDIRMEYYEKTGGASATLAWSSARQAKEFVPPSYLFLPSKSGNYWSNALNQYTQAGGQTPEYDDRFNLKSYAGATFTYNAQNQLISASKGTNTVQFVYDGLGRCVKRTINGVVRRIAYDDWNPIVEWDQAGNTKAWMLYGATADEILIRWDATHGALFYKRDNQGSVTHLLNASNQMVERYRYDAFGRPTILSPSNAELPTSVYGNRFLYTGREWIAELGIYDYRNRMYQPELGRFLQTDPTGFDGGDMNLFRYCADDPVNGSDPTGLLNTSATIWNRQMWFAGGFAFSAYIFDLLKQGQARFDPPTGNYKDDNVENHVARKGETRGKPGNTIYTITDENVESVNGIFVIKPTLNWWVQNQYKYTTVVKRELEHVSRWLWWQSTVGDGGVKVRAFNSAPKGIAALKRMVEKERAAEDVWQELNIHSKGRHNLKVNPEKAMDPAEIQRRIQNVGPDEHPHWHD